MEERPLVYETAEVARAGVFVSVDAEGRLQVDRGYVRPEDEAPVEPVPVAGGDGATTATPLGGANGPVVAQPAAITGGSRVSAQVPASAPATGPEAADEEEGIRPLPDRLLTELSVHRTLALRDAVANDPDIAFLAALHTLCLRLFYHRGGASCLELELKSVVFSVQPPDLTASAAAILRIEDMVVTQLALLNVGLEVNAEAVAETRAAILEEWSRRGRRTGAPSTGTPS